MQKVLRGIVVALGLAALVGCATIMGNPSQTVPIASTPDGATVEIVDEKGVSVFKGTTPTTVTLPKSNGTYFGGKTYTVSISAPGYATAKITLDTQPNLWYIGGNLIFGGLIGYLIVDPMSGAMYTLTPGDVSHTLDKSGAEPAPATEKAPEKTAAVDGIRVALVQDLPAHLLEKLVRVN